METKVKKLRVVDEVLSLAWIFLLSIVVVRDNSVRGIVASAVIFVVCYSLFLAGRAILMRK